MGAHPGCCQSIALALKSAAHQVLHGALCVLVCSGCSCLLVLGSVVIVAEAFGLETGPNDALTLHTHQASTSACYTTAAAARQNRRCCNCSSLLSQPHHTQQPRKHTDDVPEESTQSRSLFLSQVKHIHTPAAELLTGCGRPQNCTAGTTKARGIHMCQVMSSPAHGNEATSPAHNTATQGRAHKPQRPKGW